jgi:hypothetical protein
MNKWFVFIFLSSFLACLPESINNPSTEKGSEKKDANQKLHFQKLSWKDLDSLNVSYYFDADYGDYLGKPIFSDKIKAWHGKNVSIEGYWIPISEIGDSTVSVLSALPYTQCFFCSGAGIETVMQIKSDKTLPKMNTDDKVSLKGKLLLNGDNPMELYYQLVNVTTN